MSKVEVSYYDLNGISSEVSRISRGLKIISNEIASVSSQVDDVKNNVYDIKSDINRLQSEFHAFVAESERVANLADAKQNIIILEQELNKKFQTHKVIREHTIGILEASDIEIIKKESIISKSENLMMSAPKYWLAPALIAISAWMANKKELAETALREAIRRDDEKTSLLFCLVCRRASRFEASIEWLERYFSMQNPEKMDRNVIVILDGFASGLFGTDANGKCFEKIYDWIKEISSRAGFIDEQRTQWSESLLSKKASINDDVYPHLSRLSDNWEDLKDSMEWAKTHHVTLEYFENIFSSEAHNLANLNEKIDAVLEKLIHNYDSEELPVQKNLRKNQIIVEENGHMKEADERFKMEFPAYEQYKDFSQHLTNIALHPESSGAFITTQKLAISLSKEWIKEAYEDITAKKRALMPSEIEIKLDDFGGVNSNSIWEGITKDGSNEEELISSLSDFGENAKKQLLERVKFFNRNVLVFGVIGILIAFFALKSGSISTFLIVLGVMAVFVFLRKNKNKKEKEELSKKSDAITEDMKISLQSFLAELVDYQREYAKCDKKAEDVIYFFDNLKEINYIKNAYANKTRQVII